MGNRPELGEINNSGVFLEYYFLLEELKSYCKENGLPATGAKQEITARIAHFMDTGEVLPPASKIRQGRGITEISLDDVIEENIRFSEVHRRFFKSVIGAGFTFKVAFQEWLKENAGKTYREAADAYFELAERAKSGKTVISKQFEYNTYIRDFFAENPAKSLEDAIRCWKLKKNQPGHNRYEKADLASLKMKKET